VIVLPTDPENDTVCALRWAWRGDTHFTQRYLDHLTAADRARALLCLEGLVSRLRAMDPALVAAAALSPDELEGP